VSGPEPAAPEPVVVLDREVVVRCERGAVVVLDREAVAVLDPGVVAALALAAAELELVALSTFATVGLCEPPPHPATRTALMSAAAASGRARGGRPRRFRWLLSCMRSPSGLLRVCPPVLRDGRFRHGFVPRGRQPCAQATTAATVLKPRCGYRESISARARDR
jgi:hypothetical protein